MTRKEQIEKAATDYINSDAVSPMNMQLAFGDFINGAEWADKTMIDKAINWLKENARNYIVDIGDRWEYKTIVGGMCWVDLRKYLEE